MRKVIDRVAKKVLLTATSGALLTIGIYYVLRPTYGNARQNAQRTYCTNTLLAIVQAKAAWAAGNWKNSNDEPAWTNLIGFNYYLREEPRCPAHGRYSINAMNQKPTCTIPGHTLP